MLLLLLKSSLILIVFLAFYKLFLERESFFAANRLYLLLSLALSFTLPFVLLPKLVNHQGYLLECLEYQTGPIATTIGSKLPEPEATEVKSGNRILEPKEETISYTITHTTASKNLEEALGEPVSVLPEEKGMAYWLFWIYLFGVAVLSLNLIAQVAGTLIRALRTKDKIIDEDGIIVNLNATTEPCSFFQYIFINPASYDYETYEQIIAHEKVHVRQWHSIDLLVSELVIIVLWFNPFAWLFRKEIEKNIEYQTDAILLQNRLVEKEQYQLNLLKVATYNKPLAITTNYNQSLLKQRILKMSAKKSHAYSYWKYAFLAPLVFTLLLILNKPNIANTQSFNTSSLENDIFDKEECLALIEAIEEGNIEQVKELLSEVDPNCATEISKRFGKGKDKITLTSMRTPLLSAAEQGNLELTKLLIEKDADINFHTKGNDSPLTAAAAKGHLEVVEYLIEKGADVNQNILGVGTALAAATESNQNQVVKYLIDNGAEENPRLAPEAHSSDAIKVVNATAPILKAIEEGDFEKLQQLIAEGEDVNQDIYGTGTSLILAAQNGDLKTVEYLVENGADINQDSYGVGTPLIAAINRADKMVIEYLLSEGADIDAASYGIGTALSVAIQSKNDWLVELLLNQGADLDAHAYGVGTPLINAVLEEDFERVNYLINKGANVNTACYGIGTPLSEATRIENPQLVEDLLSKGADPNAHAFGSDTPLLIAVKQENIQIAALLLQNGADPYLVIADEPYPLKLAMEKDNTELHQLMKGYKDESKRPSVYDEGQKEWENIAINANDCQMLLKAIEDNDIPGIQRLVQEVDPNCIYLSVDNQAQSDDGKSIVYFRSPRTPLVWAARKGNLSVVKLLVEAGSNVNLYSKGDHTPLIAAASSGHLEIVKYLIAKGAEVNQMLLGEGRACTIVYTDRSGININYAVDQLNRSHEIGKTIPGEGTALIAAARMGHLNVVKYLLEKGAAIDTKVNSQGTALICAVGYGHYNIVKLLLENGADTAALNKAGQAQYHGLPTTNNRISDLLNNY